MAHWDSQGIIIDAHKFGDYDAILSIFTAQKGVCRGVLKGGFRSKNRALIEPGNIVQAQWNARLEQHLGRWQIEPEELLAARLMHSRTGLAALNSLCALLRTTLAEHDPHPRLYAYLTHVLHRLCDQDAGAHWAIDYVRFEFLLLEETGFGLDLDACAVTGQNDDLRYVSPKSGRAVGAIPGKPYHEKLLPFPTVFHDDMPDQASVHDGLKVTGHFLHHWLLASIHKPLPQARLQLIEMLEKAVS